jgi:hypothetical protein
MHIDIATLLFAMTVCMVTMAIALPAVMGQVNAPARRAQAGVLLQGSGWALLLLSGWPFPARSPIGSCRRWRWRASPAAWR